MSDKSGLDLAHLFFDGVDVKAANSELQIESSVVAIKKHVRAAAYPSLFVTGQHDGGLVYDGWLDSTTAAQIGDSSGLAKVISVLHEGNVSGAHFFGLQSAAVGGRVFTMPQEDLDTLTPLLVVDGEVDFGFVVATYANRTTDGNTQSTYVDLGAAADTGGRLYMNIGAIDVGGGSGVTVTLQHSTDHSSWGDHANGVLTIANAIGAQCLNISAAVYRYVAMKWAWTGGTSQSFSAFVGFAPN